jgi:acyl-coenzyme A synthetase/AMP-(fatty) acid ligase
VAECAVLLSERTGRIDAFVAAAGDAPTPDDLARHARDWLPSAAVPFRWLLLDQLPRTSNGKVDHRALARHASGNGDVSGLGND